MEILSRQDVAEAARRLRAGEVLIFPTETAYGLGGLATDPRVAKRVFRIKKRPRNKPLLAVVDTIPRAKKFLIWDEQLDRLAKRYWPGPLTIIGRARPRSGLPGEMLGPNNTLALRVTRHPFLNRLVASLRQPLIATSANLAGEPEIYDFVEIKKSFARRPARPDAIVDAGKLRSVSPTTIVDATGERPVVRRHGRLRIAAKFL